MPRVKVTTLDGEEQVLEAVGDWPDYKSVIEAHGYDPAVVDWSVDDPDADLQEAIKNASNLQELKDALTNSDHPAKSRGR